MSTNPDPTTDQPDDTAGLSGRQAQAARNDRRILQAAREVLVMDPDAPVSAVADRAGVGMSALYRRFDNKQEMVRQVCHDGLRRYITLAERALALDDDWEAFVTFLDEVIAADVHTLTVRLAGTFEPTEQMGRDAAHAADLAAQLVARGHASDRLRTDFDVQDATMLLELTAAVRLEDPDRTTSLRRRYLTLLLDGLTTPVPSPLPGPPPTADEFARRWDFIDPGAEGG